MPTRRPVWPWLDDNRPPRFAVMTDDQFKTLVRELREPGGHRQRGGSADAWWDAPMHQTDERKAVADLNC